MKVNRMEFIGIRKCWIILYICLYPIRIHSFRRLENF